MTKTESVVGKQFSIPGLDTKAGTLDGMKVVDAKKPLTIEITAKDISGSRSKKPDKCAAAVACLRETKATSARVHLTRTYLLFGKQWVRYITPMRLQKEIVAFDRGGSFEPGEYNLYAPQPSKKIGTPQKKKAKKPSGGKTSKGGYHFTANVRDSAYSK